MPPASTPRHAHDPHVAAAAHPAAPPPPARRDRGAALFVLLALALLLVVPIAVALRLGELRGEIATLSEPARTQVDAVQTELARQVSAVRGHLLTGDSTFLRSVAAAETELERANDSLTTLAARLGPPVSARVVELQGSVARWSAGAELLLEGRLTREEYRARLPEQQARYEAALADAAALGQVVSAAAQERRQRLARLTWVGAATTMVLALLALMAGVVVWRFLHALEERERAAARLARDEEALRELVGTLSTTFDLGELLQRIADGALEAGRAGGAFVERVDTDHTTVRVAAVAGTRTPAVGVRVPYPGSLAENVLETATPQVVPRLADEIRPIAGELKRTCADCTALVVPLLSEGQALGALILLRAPDAPPFRPGEVRRVSILGHLAAVALRRTLLYEDAERRRRQLERAEAGVRASEAAHRTLVEAAPLMMWLNEPDGTMRFANRQWHAYTGLAPAQLPEGWLARVLPDEERRRVREAREAAIARGEPYELDVPLRRRDGEMRWHHVRVVPARDPAGRITAWIGAASDVDELRRAERRQRFLAGAGEALGSSLDAERTLGLLAQLAVPTIADYCIVDLLDADGALMHRAAMVHADPASAQLLARQGAFPPPDDPANPIRAALEQREPLLLAEMDDGWLQRFARGPEHLAGIRALAPRSVIVAPLVARQRAVGVLTLACSTSGRRFDAADLELVRELARRAALALENARLFRRAEQARADADRASQAKSQFLAIMSHEIRTPINAVMGYADLLESGVGGELTAVQAQYTDRIKGSSRHLAALVNDVLDLARVEAGELRVRLADSPLARPVDDAIAVVLPLLQQKKLELRADASCQAPLRYHGDEDRVRQVLINVLSNAAKFTPPGGWVRVRCRVHATRPDAVHTSVEGPFVSVEVQDSGPGIAPEHLTRIFDPFVQVEMTYTRAQGGTGLGLTISRSLARLMGGDLTARSEVGRGSCFALWLAGA